MTKHSENLSLWNGKKFLQRFDFFHIFVIYIPRRYEKCCQIPVRIFLPFHSLRFLLWKLTTKTCSATVHQSIGNDNSIINNTNNNEKADEKLKRAKKQKQQNENYLVQPKNLQNFPPIHQICLTKWADCWSWLYFYTFHYNTMPEFGWIKYREIFEESGYDQNLT